MIKIAVLDDYLHLAAAEVDWSSLAADVEFFDDTIHHIDQLVARLEPFDAIVMMRERTFFPRAVLERLPNLKLLAGTGRRQKNVDLEAATQLGIPVCITTGGGGHGNTTAELTWGLVLALTRHIAWEDGQMRQGRWQTRLADGLGGKTLAILGLGRIGKVVAEYARAFEMDVIAWGPTLDAQRCRTRGVGRTVLPRRCADDSRAALDVYDIEPLPSDHPLLALNNVLLSPHSGYNAESMLRQFYRDSVDNLQAWMADAPSNVLNEEVLDHRRQ
jgi:phosphoglycerate dehydrogenase-like enzyme